MTSTIIPITTKTMIYATLFIIATMVVLSSSALLLNNWGEDIKTTVEIKGCQILSSDNKHKDKDISPP